MRFVILLGAIVITTANIASGQTREIVGRILDYETQQPVKNANIVIAGTSRGTISNFLGYFQLTIDTAKHTSFVVSHIGYQTSELPVPDEDRFKFFLNKEYQQLKSLNLAQYPMESPVEDIELEAEEQNIKDMIIVESNAMYEGGIDLFYDYMGNYLAEKVTPIPEHGINVLFSIDESGRPTNIEVLNAPADFAVAVQEAFSSMQSWIPATQRQNKTIQHFALPITLSRLDNTSPLLAEFYDFIANTTNYPAQARQMGKEGVVYIEFILNSSSSIVSSKVLKDIGGGCSGEVSRVINSIPPHLLRMLAQATSFNKFVLPVAFGLEIPFKGKSNFKNGSAYLLREVPVVAVGIIREVRVTGSNWGQPASPSRISGFPYQIMESFTFRTLPEALNNSKIVTRLELSNNGLTSFPGDIIEFRNLEVLDLEKNQLGDLPNVFNKLPKLKELYLYGNQLSDLPETFEVLKKLTTLSLGSNQFTYFPRLTCSLKDLELLDFSENNIKELPENIGDLKKLRVIILRDNKINRLPESFYTLTNLEQISLEGNPLEAEDITKLKSTFSKAELTLN